MNLIGLLIGSTAVILGVAYGQTQTARYPMYPVYCPYGYGKCGGITGGGYNGGQSGSGYGGIFNILIFLFVLIIVIRALFEDGGLGGESKGGKSYIPDGNEADKGTIPEGTHSKTH